MKKIRETTILDLLPFTFKTSDKKALSAAIASLTADFYDRFSAVLFWGNIEGANPVMLDIMAAELDCPFYNSNMSVEHKRSIIAAAFVNNRQIGTASSVNTLLSAAFGNGKVLEWYEYGGQPYFFKTQVKSTHNSPITQYGSELFVDKISEIKPKRAKLVQAEFSRDAVNNINIAMRAVKVYKKMVVPAGQVPDSERGFY